METPDFVLFEHAVGYAIFKIKEFEELGQSLPEVEASVPNLAKFGNCTKLVSFSPFSGAEAALENCNAISEGIVTEELVALLETHLPAPKKGKVKLGVTEMKLASSIAERLPHISCSWSGVVPEIMRGVRIHFGALAKGLDKQPLATAQLGLGHSYSRAKVKFNVNRADNMIIQAISLLDQLDKDINTFGMRIREWYSYHFPELYRIVPDQYMYSKVAHFIEDRKTLEGDKVQQLAELVDSEDKATEIVEASKMSMGMDISDMDLMNIHRFAQKVVGLAEYRKELQAYLSDRMGNCAPSLSALIGDQVGARLISHAGSLTNLAKYPASTVQILGAEKALFRALKTKGATPKYGLLFHSSFIGRASMKNKGRISRYLANKCSMASRIDCFSECPVSTYGEHLKQQVEDRLKYFDSGTIPKKNIAVMGEAAVEAVQSVEKEKKRRKKQAKREKKAQAQLKDETETFEVTAVDTTNDSALGNDSILEETDKSAKKKKKKKKSLGDIEPGQEAVDEAPAQPTPTSPQKGKKRKKGAETPEEPAVAEAEVAETEEPVKKKKKKKPAA